MRLFIAEKPSVAKAIVNELGVVKRNNEQKNGKENLAYAGSADFSNSMETSSQV